MFVHRAARGSDFLQQALTFIKKLLYIVLIARNVIE